MAGLGYVLDVNTLTFSTGAESKNVPLLRTLRSVEPLLLSVALTLVFPTIDRLSTSGDSLLLRLTAEELTMLHSEEKAKTLRSCILRTVSWLLR